MGTQKDSLCLALAISSEGQRPRDEKEAEAWPRGEEDRGPKPLRTHAVGKVFPPR